MSYCLFTILITSCAMPQLSPITPVGEIEKSAIDAAQELDAIAMDIEEFGSITASSAAFISTDSLSEFKFNLDMSPKEIFASQAVQASSSINRLEELAIRAAFAYSGIPLPSNSPAETPPATPPPQNGTDNSGSEENTEEANDTSDTGGDTTGTDNNADTTGGSNTSGGRVDLPELPEATSPQAITGGFTKPFGLINTDELNLSFRDLLKRTFDDHTTMKMFEWLSSPDNSASNYQLFASVITVSLTPGRHTYSGYVGEIDIRLEYGAAVDVPIKKTIKTKDNVEQEREAKNSSSQKSSLSISARSTDNKYRALSSEEISPSIPDEQDGQDDTQTGTAVLRGIAHPIAFAVFPMLDTQVLDLRTSIRRQFALNLLLQALFPDQAGQLITNYTKRLEQDTASRSTINSVVGYNSGGRHFGWRFSPNYTAQLDPSRIDTGPGTILQPQAFPALVMFAAAKKDLLYVCKQDKKCKDEPKRIRDSDRTTGPYDHLLLHSRARMAIFILSPINGTMMEPMPF